MKTQAERDYLAAHPEEWLKDEIKEFKEKLDPKEYLDVLGCFVKLAKTSQQVQQFLEIAKKELTPKMVIRASFIAEDDFREWTQGQIKRKRVPISKSTILLWSQWLSLELNKVPNIKPPPIDKEVKL